MSRLDDTLPAKPASLTLRIVHIVKSVPKGKVATYGQIAGMAGNPHASRLVVRVLNAYSKAESLPWYRVVNSRGTISLKPGFGYEEQRKQLVSEGIVFDDAGKIDFRLFQWRGYY
jgi:methylated-DNA-protein-cysteine methyltransferase related protein